LLEVKTAMPGLFWMAQLAQRRPNRRFLATLSIQMFNNGFDVEDRGQDQLMPFY
jgi:hypothetical protein